MKKQTKGNKLGNLIAGIIGIITSVIFIFFAGVSVKFNTTFVISDLSIGLLNLGLGILNLYIYWN